MKSAFKRALEVSGIHKQILQAMHDLVLGALCLTFAFALKPLAKTELDPLHNVLLVIMVPGVAVAVFSRAGVYRAILRDITGSSLQAIVPGVALPTVVLGLGLALLGSPFSVPVLLHYALLFLFGIAGSRLLLRGLFRFAVAQQDPVLQSDIAHLSLSLNSQARPASVAQCIRSAPKETGRTA